MRRILPVLLLAVCVLPLTAQAQFKRYFDVGTLRIEELKEPDWAVRAEENHLRYLCMSCPSPTAVQIKGVIRGESLPEAFENGALSPTVLKSQGEATAIKLGSKFLGAEPLTVGEYKGVQMEASAEMHGTIYFVTRWIGQGDKMLDIKVTARDLEFARKLADKATASLVPQVFAK
jgi:hypothetical protein